MADLVKAGMVVAADLTMIGRVEVAAIREQDMMTRIIQFAVILLRDTVRMEILATRGLSPRSSKSESHRIWIQMASGHMTCTKFVERRLT